MVTAKEAIERDAIFQEGYRLAIEDAAKIAENWMPSQFRLSTVADVKDGIATAIRRNNSPTDGHNTK